MPDAFDNPAGWPSDVVPLFQKAVTCEFATLTKRGTPVTYPLNPYIGEDGRTLDVSTGMSYPAKAERVRRNPKVAMLFSDRVGLDLPNPPVVLVLGEAAVRDADVQAGADRYAKAIFEKFPEVYGSMPRAMLRRQHWYLTRIWMLMTPLRILWWPGGNLDVAPEEWTAPPGTHAEKSDPAPKGKQAPPWAKEPADWRKGAESAVRDFPPPVLTVVDRDGYPIPFPTGSARVTPGGFMLDIPKGMPVAASGAACLTFHKHPKVFVGQHNMAFVGQVEPSGEFRVERRLADFSLGLTKMSTGVAFFISSVRLTPALKRELARRGKPLPTINLPQGEG